MLTTHHLLTSLNYPFYFLTFLVLTLYFGKALNQKENQNEKTNHHALPLHFFFTQMISLFLLIFFLLTLFFLLSLMIQISNGYFKFNFGLYIKHLYFYELLKYLNIGALAFFFHTFFSKKYAYALMILVFFVNFLNYFTIEEKFLSWKVTFGVNFLLSDIFTFLLFLTSENKLLAWNATPQLIYSEMNGYKPFWVSHLIFRLYWLSLSLIFLTSSFMFWKNNKCSSIKNCWISYKQKLYSWKSVFLISPFLAFFILGGFIHYNTHFLNPLVSFKKKKTLESLYKENYNQAYESKDQLEVISIKTELDFFPKKNASNLKMLYHLKNKTDQLIDTVFVDFNHQLKFNLSFSKEFYLLEKNEDLGVYIYKLNQAVKPKEKITMEYELNFKRKGIFNSNFNFKNMQIFKNGTYISNTFLYSYFPHLGYKNKDLESLYNTRGQKHSYLSKEGTWIHLESILSTSLDQIALAPGKLVRSWKEKNRNYFHYKTDQPIVNRYAFLSGKYSIQKSKWQNTNLEFYYHPKHNQYVSSLIKTIKSSLSYFTEHFGSYPHKSFRLVEVPRYYRVYGSYLGKTFSTMVSVSEDLFSKYKMNEKGERAISMLLAHETAHQWWGEKVIGARVRGAYFLSESLAEYLGFMVLEQMYGLEIVKKVLKSILNQYLKERKKYRTEKPLILSKNPSVYYRKGGFLLYALKNLIGEQELNSILKEFFNTYTYKGSPFPRSIELIDLLKKKTDPKYHTFISDSFEKVVIYDHQISRVECKRDSSGRKKIKVTVLGEKKYFYSSKKRPEGEEITDISLGVSDKEGKWIHFKKYELKIGKNSFSILIDENQKPYQVILDPSHIFIDENLKNNRVYLRNKRECLT